jgi:two-component system, cell cycle sensor histidine kinase and response regulator CckA
MNLVKKTKEELLRKAECERENSESIFRTIFENSGTATIVVEEDMTASLINHEFEILSGFTKEEVEGKMKWTEFFHPEDLVKAKQYHNLRRIEPQNAPRQYEIRLIDKQGNIKILNNTVAVIPGTKRSIASFIDITERRKIEDDCRESEFKYRTLFESAGDAILLVDEDIVVVDCNQRALEMFKCSREKMLDPCRERFCHEFEPNANKRDMKATDIVRAALNGETGPFCGKCRRDDGLQFEAEIKFNHIFWKGKKYIQTIVRDISDRVRTEELYQTIANTSSAGVYIIQDGQFKFVNPNATKHTGYSMEDLIGRDDMILVHPDDRENVKKNAKRMLHNKSAIPFEFRIITNDGSIKYLVATYTYITYEGRGAILGQAMDITEMKEMRSSLDELQVLEKSILNTITHAVLGFQNREIFFVNPAAERIFGWTANELMGKDARVLYRSENDYLETGKLVYSMLEKQGTCCLEVPCRHKDGSDFFCILNASVINQNAQESRIVVVYEDITDRKKADEERKKLESQLMQSQKMEAIGTLAGGIAHDFNNLLMGIQGCTSILMIDLHDKSQHYERLKAIEDLVQNGADLTRQLLGFARGGRYELKTININEIIEKTVSLFGRTKKEIAVHRNFADDIIYVNADRGQMDQLLLNLLVNAWQAMPEGGDIYLRTEKVFLDNDFVHSYGVDPGKYVKISIEDTGIGMDAKTKERIFEPFFTTKEITKGTGLGLAIVYGIVRAHGGIITVVSKPNKGSQFDIYLPISEKEQEDEIRELGEIVKGDETILLVDDEEVIVEVSKEILEILGYNILVAHSGHEAINIYSEKKDVIDLVIQDMVMPGMSGMETFHALKIINPAVKVILSSGYVINQKIESIMEQGCRDFIQKPFRMEELSKKVRNVLDKP